MKFTRRKTYWLLLGVGGAALVVDRLILTESIVEPWEAEAVEPATDRGPSAPKVPPADDAPQAIPELPFPTGLSALGVDRSIHDLFTPPSRRSSATVGGANRPDSAVSAKASFVATHRLEAVFAATDVQVAVISGEWIKLGEKIGGCELRRLEGTKACFFCDDGEAILDLSATAEDAER